MIKIMKGYMTFPNTGSNVVSFFTANFASNTFFTRASSPLMAKIGSCKLEKGYCYLIDNYQSKLKVNTKTDCREYRINYKKRNKTGSTKAESTMARLT